MLTIVNSFDELDVPPSKFFEAAKPDVYHLSQDDDAKHDPSPGML